MGQTNAIAGLRNLGNEGLIARKPTASEQAKQKGLTDRLGKEKAKQLGIEMAKGGAGLTEDYNQKFINALEGQVNIKEAGQKRRVRERKRTIFAGGNVNDNIFRRTLGGL
jgi:hypothetical protein